MADVSEIVEEYDPIVTTDTGDAVSFEGKRDISFSYEATAVSGSSPSSTVTIEHTTTDSSLHASSFVWEVLLTFTAVTAASAYETKTIIDDGTKKDVARFFRVINTISGSSPSFTSKVRIAYNRGITE